VRLAVLLLMIAGAVFAQAPDCSVAPGYKQTGPARTYDKETLFEYMDGNSEGYFAYDFTGMKGVSCEKLPVRLVIDVSEFASEDLAWGMFASSYDARQPTAKLGMAGQILPRRASFAKGKYFIEVAADPEGDHTAILTQVAQALEKKYDGRTTLPAELTWFPTANRLPGSPRLVPQSVLGIGILKRGYLSLYENGKAFVVPEASPETASALMKKLAARFGGGEPAKVGDEAFLAQDKFLGRMCIFRKGEKVAGFVSVADGADPVALAAGLLATLP
jgi:hypothetical protein